MHYIRCLRPARTSTSGRSTHLDLVFTITTDLGDSFMFPESTFHLEATVHVSSSSASQQSLKIPLSQKGQLVWKPGQRVAKPTFALPPAVARALSAGLDVDLCVGPEAGRSADSALGILSGGTDDDDDGGGLVMPVWIALNRRGKSDEDDGGDEERHVSTRRLNLGGIGKSSRVIDVDEEMGESIARHIWDAGVVALCAIANSLYDDAASGAAGSSIPMSSSVEALKNILKNDQEPLNILELGCGVGILGAGLASICAEHRSRDSMILMTDLDEAENQARSNISKLNLSGSCCSQVTIEYENLDWEDGRKGVFGPHASSRRWDLIALSDCTYNVDMLPALVETLSALHSRNVSHGVALRERARATKIFLATKPRHSSERALFDLMEKHQWQRSQEQRLRLPVVGSEAQSVEMYLFEKS